MSQEWIILLHGLARSKWSMWPLVQPLRRAGYQVLNAGYPSRSASIEQLAHRYVPQAFDHCRTQGATRIHVVTHSMGGIITRVFLKDHHVPDLGHVVMLAPPNGGSEVVDRIGHWWLFQVLHGPAGTQLGTAAHMVPAQLGPVDFPLGVITGRRSLNLLLSLLFAGPNDGKVSVERAQVAGMRDFLVVDSTHPTILWNKQVHQAIIRFLQQARFT